MHLWIMTVGSSDIQLISDKENQAKGRTSDQQSNKVWRSWYTEELQEECYDIIKDFEPKLLFQGQSYRVFPRVIGKVYQASSEAVQAEIWDYLTFPLLDNFVQALDEHPMPEAIAVLLTDQSTIFENDFESDSKRRPSHPSSPYWQDTCELKPILQRYFVDKFPNALCEFIPLIPDSESTSLDNWNAILDLVRGKFSNLTVADQLLQIYPGENVYVSHQAGTPAISSAVQFCSLAKFGDRVKFLVSSEQSAQPPDILPSSSYLKGIRKQEAQKLLERYDYAGVKDLVADYLVAEEYQDTKILLEAAIQWNFAKFDEFVKQLNKHSVFAFQVRDYTKEENWWWTAYDAAYLAFIRLDQQNGTEAFFHSFRAVEGLISKWAEVNFPEHIDPNNDSPKLRASILDVPNLNYFGKNKYAEHKLKLQHNGSVVLSGFPLYTLLRSAKPNWKKDCKEITDFIEKIAPTRNKVFHRLRGLGIDDVFEAWLIDITKTKEEKTLILEEKIRKYLNFIVKEDFPEGFASLEEASLMAQVHKKLVSAIASL